MVPVAVAFYHFKKFLLAFHRRGQVRFRTHGVNRALTQEKNKQTFSSICYEVLKIIAALLFNSSVQGAVT